MPVQASSLRIGDIVSYQTPANPDVTYTHRIVAIDPDGYSMGGLGGSFGWWSEAGQYAMAFLTGHIGDHERGDRLEGAVRDVLGLPPV